MKRSKNDTAEKIEALVSRVARLENDLYERIKLTPEYEKESKEFSRKTSEFRNRAKEAKEAAEKSLHSTINILESIRGCSDGITEKRNEIFELNEKINNSYADINKKYENIVSLEEVFFKKIEKIEEVLGDSEELPGEIDKYRENLEEMNELHSEVKTLHSDSLDKQGIIEDLYFSINGRDITKDDGQVERVDGLKDKLKSTYNSTVKKIDELNSNIKEIKSKSKDDFNEMLSLTDSKFSDFISRNEKSYKSIHKKITDLLPAALTAGLSHAYEEKKKTEERNLISLQKSFNVAILGLILVSVIPFVIDIYLFFVKNLEVIAIIEGTPNLIFAISPLYFPVLWMAHSSNKKLNLSKRLLEEYTHKEVLSKTYEGLSQQIKELPDEMISDDLRSKLLYNILEVNSENPGKLISDYNKSDHPLMDALEKSAKLANSVEKLAKIPGFSKLAKSLDSKAQALLNREEKKINSVLEDGK